MLEVFDSVISASTQVDVETGEGSLWRFLNLGPRRLRSWSRLLPIFDFYEPYFLKGSKSLSPRRRQIGQDGGHRPPPTRPDDTTLHYNEIGTVVAGTRSWNVRGL